MRGRARLVARETRRAHAGPVGLLLVAAAALASCGTPEREQTPAQWVKENTRIISQLASYRAEEQQEGINRFLALGKEQGSEVVAYFLDDPVVSGDDRVVAVLARILSIWKDPRGIPYLLDALERSRDEGILRIVEEGLSAYGENSRISNSLEGTIASPRPMARLASASVLSRMRNPRTVEILGRRMRDEENVEVRAVCLFGIVESQPSARRTELLVEALTDPDPEIRRAAWAALRETARPPDVFDPMADLASRARGISELRRWLRGR